MRPIGFSTGALAKSDFVAGLRQQRGIGGIRAIELSALRDHELKPLVAAISYLDIAAFHYVSFHAPSTIGKTLSEKGIFELLTSLPAHWPIIVHPELLSTPALWRRLGTRLCIENMDNRKSTGRTVEELRQLFDVFPEATFCLDVGHAKQIDPTMTLAILMLRAFGHRLKQVHVSDVGARGEHLAVGVMARVAFSRIATYIPATCPLIIESVIQPEGLLREIDAVLTAFEASASSETGDLEHTQWRVCVAER